MSVVLTMTADALILEEIARDLDRAKLSPAARAGVDAARELITDYFDAQRALEERLHTIGEDKSLSAVGQADKQTREKQKWLEQAERLLDDLETRTGALVKNAERQLTPPPLASDATLAHLRLEAAERHLHLLLTDIPLARLPDELRDLATDGQYPDVTFLIAATSYASMLLRSKGAIADAERFERTRYELLRGSLPPAGVQALDDLPGLKDADRLAPSMRGLHQGLRYRYGIRG